LSALVGNNERANRGWLTNFNERFLYYGTWGLWDPKNYTIEPWFLGGGTIGWSKSAWSKPTLAGFGRGLLLSQTIAFVGVGFVGGVWDPLEQFPDEGLDDTLGLPTLIDAGNWTQRRADTMNRNWNRMMPEFLQV